MENEIFNSLEYREWINEIKNKIKASRIKASLKVNSELIFLYWEIGSDILQKQDKLGWGAKVIDSLSKDLQKVFPDMKGFSLRNLKYMRKFAESYDFTFVQGVLAQITWYHNLALLEKLQDNDQRIWYAKATIENGWSRNILVHQIESNLYKRQGKALTNFDLTMTKPQSDLAQQMLKDPYKLDFIGLGDDAHELDIEKALTEHITKFLLELGAGFAYVGRQYHLEVGGDDFYIDLLFYHLKLRCYVVIELKTGDFKPEYAGKLNFYLSVVDDLIKHPSDNPSVGIILCKGKNKVVAEYALRDINKPMGISEYKLTESIPENLKGSLPTIEELEMELGD